MIHGRDNSLPSSRHSQPKKVAETGFFQYDAG
jgi:hypothetical protein